MRQATRLSLKEFSGEVEIAGAVEHRILLERADKIHSDPLRRDELDRINALTRDDVAKLKGNSSHQKLRSLH